ncbi:SHOCT domain-containing protein [Streptomyces sanyensis]|uniref:SHOCT domain-containing protein n=1 Tax=Streptomyces sanyensis TaxID=568869 RepID=UPI003D7718F0
MPQRFGRPGLLGAMARTAVVAGTATAVSGRVERNAARRDMERQAQAGARQQPPPDPGAAPAAPPADRVSQLTALAELRDRGVLTDEEFAAEKRRILGG